MRLLNNVAIAWSIIFYIISAYFLGTIRSREDNEDEIFPYITTKKEGEYIIYREPILSNGDIIASKSGTKYYYVWCSGLNRIKEENKIYFETEESAEAEGLTLSKTCN